MGPPIPRSDPVLPVALVSLASARYPLASPPEVPVPEPTDIAVETVEVEAPEEALVEESLVEEVSIDGMCGVY